MKRATLFILLSSCLVFTGIITTEAQTQFSGLAAGFFNYRVNRGISLHLDAQVMSGDQLKNCRSVLLRPGVNWHFHKNLVFSAGYVYLLNHRTVGGISGNMPEHATWQQLVVSHAAGAASLAHRFRLEQRFIGRAVTDNNTLRKEGYQPAHRFRHFTRGVLPFSGKKKFSKGMFGALQNEVFLNIGDKSNVNGRLFDQNRLYAALGYRFGKTLDGEVGYMNQYISQAGNNFVNNHIVQVATYIKL